MKPSPVPLHDQAGVRTVALFCVSVGLVALLIPIVAAAAGQPALATFGSFRSTFDALQLAGCALLGLAHLSYIALRQRAGSWMLLSLAGLAACLLPVTPAKLDIGGEWLAFAILATLIYATLLMTPETRRTDAAAALIASLAIGPLLLLLSGLLSGSMPAGAGLLSVSSIFCLLMLTAGLLVMTTGRLTSGIGDQGSAGWRAMQLAVPALMMVPALIGVTQLLVLPNAAGKVTDFIAISINTMVVGLLLLWALRRISAERNALVAFARAVDASAVIIVDADDLILYWSQGCEQLYGYSASEAKGCKRYELTGSRPLDGRRLADVSDGERRSGLRLIERCADGGEAIVHQTMLAAKEDQGLPVRILSVTDIGHMLTAEKALADREVQLMLAAQVHRIGMFQWDARTGKLEWLANTGEFVAPGISGMDSYDRWAEWTLPEDREITDRRREAAIWAKAERFSFQYRVRPPDGVVRVIEGSARCFYDAEGVLVRTIGVNIDVTERVERERQLAAREAQLLSILETVPDAMIVIDEQGTILTFSRAAEAIFGYNADAVVGDDISKLMPPGMMAQHHRAVRRYLETGERRVIGFERRLMAKRADGTEFPIEARVGEVRANGTRLFTGFLRDMSESDAAERKLAVVRDELAHAGRINAMGEMAAGLAHEINQPLAAISNYLSAAETLNEAGRTTEATPLLREAREQTLRAGKIIRRLRDFVAGRERDPQALLVEDIIREAVALLLAGFPDSRVSVEYDLDNRVEMMFADRIQVQQILFNLLRNALEAVTSQQDFDRRLTISSKTIDRRWIEIAVSDRGPGLRGVTPEQLFTPFISTKSGQGMGIGLSICKRLVEAQGGNLTFEERPGGGARFYFTIPRYEPLEDAA